VGDLNTRNHELHPVIANSTIAALSREEEQLKNVKCFVAVQPVSVAVFVRNHIKNIFTHTTNTDVEKIRKEEKMKLSMIANGLLVMLLVMDFSSVMKSSEFQITADSNIQQYPAIYGNVVVWKDDRNGNWDIYGYDLSTENEFQITEDVSDQEWPAIYGNTVVWKTTGMVMLIFIGMTFSLGRNFK
jgi:beta propeller repeat protein